MYYNIKIKTKDSQFVLESTTKAIIQREMDIYFSCFYDVSDEFKQKVKASILNRNSVLAEKNVEQNIEKSHTEKIAEVKKEVNREVNTQLRTEPANQLTPELTSQPKPEITNDIKLQTEEIIIPQKQDVADSQTANIAYTQTMSKTSEQDINKIFLDTSIQNNRQLTEKLDNSVSDYAKQNTINGNMSTEKTVEISNTEPRTTAPDIREETENPELEKEAQALFEELQIQVEKEVKKELEENKEISVNKISEQLKPEIKKEIQEEIPEVSREMSPYQDIIDAYKEKNIEVREMPSYQNTTSKYDTSPTKATEMLTYTLEEPEIKKEDTKSEQNKEQISNIPISNVNFNSYLGGFTTDNISDEFLICASYIKNILRQDNFSMKYINSKLFQATGKIADTSIVDELIKMEYIIDIDSQDYIKYSITNKGEEHIAKKLQN